MEVIFEPYQLGVTTGTLILSTTIGEDYIFPLSGTAIPPTPQGPFLIRAGSSTTINFKNVFLEPISFLYAVGHPAFRVKAPETICSKETAKIVVSFDGHPSAPVTTKLLIKCPRAKGVILSDPWVYYLKGIVPEK